MNTTELLSFYRKDFFIPELTATTKEDALEELVIPLYTLKKVKSKGLVLETLRKRETLGSTGIGKGVAIPHCRSLAVSEVYIVVGLSRKGINYKAVDKKKVHLFNLIVAPPYDEANNYLRILGKFCEMVRDNKIRRQLLKVRDYSSFVSVLEVN